MSFSWEGDVHIYTSIMYLFIKFFFHDAVYLIYGYGFPSRHLGNTIFANISTANRRNNTVFGLWFTRIRTKMNTAINILGCFPRDPITLSDDDWGV